MAVVDPHQRIAVLENKLQAANVEIEWAHLKIRALEEQLRQRRVQLLGPFSETLSDLQLELLVEEEPSATAEEVEAEARRETLPAKPIRERKPHPGRNPLPNTLPRIEQVIPCAEPHCRKCGKETRVIGYDESAQLDHEPARWFVRVIKREKRACGECSTVAMPEREPRIVEKGLVLLCYKRRAQQKGQCGSWVRRKRASLIRRVAIEVGLCRSARTRRAAGFEVGRKVWGA